jgi:fimbrial chaperone protein
MTRSLRKLMTGVLCGALFVLTSAEGGEFSVNPIRLELGTAARSGAIGVKNDGAHPLSFQLQAMEWMQDAAGKDQYLETRDLIFFPKILTVDPGQAGVVRVGIKTPAVASEKTYRLFIEELPGNVVPAATKGPQINFLIRFGVPIFIAPLKAEDKLEITGSSIANGNLSVSARNTGNRHQMIQGIHLRGADADGKEVYATTLADRYLLAGVQKTYSAAITPAQCRTLAIVELELRTDKLIAKDKMAVTQAMCPAK